MVHSSVIERRLCRTRILGRSLGGLAGSRVPWSRRWPISIKIWAGLVGSKMLPSATPTDGGGSPGPGLCGGPWKTSDYSRGYVGFVEESCMVLEEPRPISGRGGEALAWSCGSNPLKRPTRGVAAATARGGLNQSRHSKPKSSNNEKTTWRAQR